MFVLFLNLEKAFDKVIREIASGWPKNLETSHVDYLLSLGLPHDTATWICTYIDRVGPVFSPWGVDERAQELIKALILGSSMAL